MSAGAIFVDHTTASAEVARELHAAAGRARPRLHRRADLRRPGRGGKGRADRDVRRRSRRLRQGGAGHRLLRARLPADGRRRAPASSPRWSIRSPSPAWSRAWPRRCISPKPPASTLERVVDLLKNGAAQSWQMENRTKTMLRRRVRLRLRRRMDAQGSGDLPRRGAAQRRAPAGRGAGRSVLRRGANRWADGAGTRRASSRGLNDEPA